jgi:hypothetical protein
VDRSKWKTAGGFRYPARRTDAERLGHPAKPTPFRIEELGLPWVDSAELTVIAEAEHRRKGEPGEGSLHSQRYVAAADPFPLQAGVFGFTDADSKPVPLSQFFGSVHLPPGGVEAEETARRVEAAEAWRKKVVVEDPAFHRHHSKDASKMGRVGSMLSGPPRKEGLRAVLGATLPSGKPVPLEPAPVSMHMAEPFSDTTTLAYVQANTVFRKAEPDTWLLRTTEGKPQDFASHPLLPERLTRSHVYKPLQAAGMRVSAEVGGVPTVRSLRDGINTDALAGEGTRRGGAS